MLPTFRTRRPLLLAVALIALALPAVAVAKGSNSHGHGHGATACASKRASSQRRACSSRADTKHGKRRPRATHVNRAVRCKKAQHEKSKHNTAKQRKHHSTADARGRCKRPAKRKTVRRKCTTSKCTARRASHSSGGAAGKAVPAVTPAPQPQPFSAPQPAATVATPAVPISGSQPPTSSSNSPAPAEAQAPTTVPGQGQTVPSSGSSQSASPPPASSERLFAASSVWNRELETEASVDDDSGAMIARLQREVNREESAGNGPWINTDKWSVPLYRVPAGQPVRSVTLDHAPDAALSGAFAAVPIPDDAQPAAGTDRHLVVYQPSSDRMWEFWDLQRQPDGWHAGWGGAIDSVSTNAGVFDATAWPGAKPWWGATATSLALAGGLMTIDELKRGRIDHALAVALPETRRNVWSAPAQRADGSVDGSDVIPEGARLRLDPKLELASLDLPPMTRMMAEAAQRYGIIVRDKASNIAFVAEDPSQYQGPDPYTNNSPGGSPKLGGLFGGLWPSQILAAFPWSHLEVMRLDLRAG